MQRLETAVDVLNFWFADSPSDSDVASVLDYLKKMFTLWFGGASDHFNKMQLHNKDIIEKIANLSDPIIESAEGWPLTPLGYLARIIVLDQFPRCCFRGTAQAFRYDDLACSYAVKLVKELDVFYSDFNVAQRLFIIMPFTHSELLPMQELAVQCGLAIATDRPAEVQQYFRGLKGFPDEHRDVLVRFGRFPSRNRPLVRA